MIVSRLGDVSCGAWSGAGSSYVTESDQETLSAEKMFQRGLEQPGKGGNSIRSRASEGGGLAGWGWGEGQAATESVLGWGAVPAGLKGFLLVRGGLWRTLCKKPYHWCPLFMLPTFHSKLNNGRVLSDTETIM